MKTLTVKV